MLTEAFHERRQVAITIYKLRRGRFERIARLQSFQADGGARKAYRLLATSPLCGTDRNLRGRLRFAPLFAVSLLDVGTHKIAQYLGSRAMIEQHAFMKALAQVFFDAKGHRHFFWHSDPLSYNSSYWTACFHFTRYTMYEQCIAVRGLAGHASTTSIPASRVHRLAQRAVSIA